MPSITITIEDTSPIISYSPGWRAGHSSDDGRANLYSQSSFTVTNVKDAFASFTFNGTAVGIFGAKRGNHGAYQVKVDNTPYPPTSGKEPDPGLFQEALFSATGLSQGLHTVTLTNQEESYLDIDFITWETTMGTNSSDKLYVNTFQDTSPSFTYLPSETDWGTPGKNLGSFMGGSGHATTKSGASLIYSFDVRDGVSLYGPVGPDGSPFSVHVDGGPTNAFTTKQEFYSPQNLLYHASSLGPGNHNLTLTYQPITPQQTFAIDYAAVFTTAAPSVAPQIQIGRSGKQLTSVAIGALAGLAVSVALLLVMTGVLLRLLRRRPKVQESHPISPPEVDFFQDTPTTSIVRTSHHSPIVPQVAPPSTYLNQDRGFHKEGFRPMNHRRNEESISTLNSISNASGSTWQSPGFVHPRTPLLTENPPQYTEDALDGR